MTMTMEDLFDLLAQEYGLKQTYGCAACIEFTTRDARELMLPAPTEGKHYTRDEIVHIISVWNEEVEDAIELTFNGFPH